MTNYYTNFIDPGNSGGSVPTPNTSIPCTPQVEIYYCRYCTQSFNSDDLRVKHEWEFHPSLYPRLMLNNKPLSSTTKVIRTQLQPSDINLQCYDKIELNGEDISTESLIDIMCQNQKYFFAITLSSGTVSKDYKVDIDIADADELEQVNELFWLFLNRADFTEELITLFVHATNKFKTVKNYVDGLVKYLHGIMAKDGNTKVLTFEDYKDKFNQAREVLSSFNTPLSQAIQAVINFNQNKFNHIDTNFLPNLKYAMYFFKNESLEYNPIASTNNRKQLPVDRVTSILLDDLLNQYDSYDIAAIQNVISSLPKSNVSLNDRRKFDYLMLRKAIEHNDLITEIKLSKALRYDDAFDLENLKENIK